MATEVERNMSETLTSFTEEPPDDIANWCIVPSQRDILRSNQLFLRPNFVGRPYPDLETYLDVQFRLLMADFVLPLRQGVTKLLSGKYQPRDVKEIRIYENVTFKRGGLVHDRQRFVPERESSWRIYAVHFNASARVNWTTSRRLIHGSLVCLWDRTSNELIVASVAHSTSKQLSKGEVLLAIESSDASNNFNMNKTYIMLESVIFFEPYRAVLQVLQNFTYDSFPVLDYILGAETCRTSPSYISTQSFSYDLRNNDGTSFSTKSLTNISSWPCAKKLGLDKRQHEALYSALTSRVSLIQGPPGTGKTFLALRILRSLLDNKSLWQGKNDEEKNLKSKISNCGGSTRRVNWHVKNKIFWENYGDNWRDDRSPIVVICFTNHALDQFLEGVLRSTEKIIRIGSQSKAPILENFRLDEVKSKVRIAQDNGPYCETNYLYYFHKMKKSRVNMEVQIGSIKFHIRQTKSEIFKISDLKRRGVISAEICEVFEEAERQRIKRKHKDNILEWWLGWSNHRQLLKVFRETRMQNRLKQVNEASAVTTKERDSTDTRQVVEENWEEPDSTASDAEVEDIVIDDDEDFKQELRLAQEEAKIETTPDEAFEDDELNLNLDCPTINGEEKILIGFAKKQLERMGFVRDLLSSIPNEACLEEDFQADQIMVMPLRERWMLFGQWKRVYREIIEQDVRESTEKYQAQIKEYNQLKGKALAALCRTADVIGMTTTGAAKNRSLLESLGAKIVIVEEAAEVLESHIVCSLTQDCQQLIMIGDHQQLRPSVNVYDLAKKYQMDVSLFERLILGGMKAVRLGVQHRMRPEIVRLIVPTIYEELENYSTVYNHPHVPGMQHDVFFYHHNYPEKEDGSSYYNVHEVDMALRLAVYLVRDHKVSPHRITILATYTAQLHHLLNSRKNYNLLEDVRMTVVDNFQGEENDVIMLSLVRNNSRNSIGFLRIVNRVCVALSRARNGLYILGNIRMLSNTSPLWSDMEKVLKEHGQIGDEISLRCDRHHEIVRKVKRSIDFPSGPFCRELCGAELQCGHVCKLVCHHEDDSHTINCHEKITKLLDCGHSYSTHCSRNFDKVISCQELVIVTKKPCMHEFKIPCSKLRNGDSNSPCLFLEMKKLSCGHIQQLPCSAPPDASLCDATVAYQLSCSHFTRVPCNSSTNDRQKLDVFCTILMCKKLLCGHSKWMMCNQDPSGFECGVPDECLLECGHSFQYTCPGKSMDEFVFSCERIVDRQMSCGHTQKSMCSKPLLQCHQKVVRVLDCGHSVKSECWNTTPTCTAVVDNKTLMCGHQQSVNCNDVIESVVCKKLVEVLHPICSHSQSVPCFIAKDQIQLAILKCKAKTFKMLSCGHEVRLPCAQKIDDSIVCMNMVNLKLPCHHMVTVPCSTSDTAAKKKCKMECGAPLDCGHGCSLKCHDHTMTHVCKKIVPKQLKCGHSMEISCLRQPFEEKCHVSISIQPACGHTLVTKCYQMSSGEVPVCHQMTEKKLPCNHSVSVECSDVSHTMTNGCKEIVPKKLKCGHSMEMPCLRQPFEEKCLESVSFQAACGHTLKTKCCKMSSGEVPVCRQMMDKKLPCNHSASVECSVSPEEVFCIEPCDHVLGCGHRVPTKCGVSLEKKLLMSCSEKKEIKLTCGHQCSLKCGSDEANKPVNSIYCRVMIEKEIPKCGHKVNAECGKKLSKYDCTSNCERKLDCGHRCSLRCREPCDTKSCKQEIELKHVNLSCGHFLRGECNLRYSDKTVIEAMVEVYKCIAPCQAKLACGHRCTARCHECQANGFHSVCVQRCKSILICGHLCEAKCGKVCPPCTKPCGYQCSHQKCSASCGDDCYMCMEICEWKCPHGKCSHPCYEFCNRKPCDKACQKRLSCGHPCNSVCGENCPPKCLSCSRKEISKYKLTSRYIYLECNHWIDVEEMDEWVNQKDKSEENIRQIRFPSCPQCLKAIRLCFRYGDQIKAFHLDLISIKWAFVKDETIHVAEKLKKAMLEWKPQMEDTEDDDHRGIESTYLRLQSVSSCKNLSSDQRWDLIYCLQLNYLMSCLVKDTKKKYVVKKNGKKDEFTLDEPSVEHILSKISQALLYMEKKVNSAYGLYFNLLSLLKRLDLYRQFYAVNSLSDRLPKSSRVNQKQLEKVACLLNMDQQCWSDAEENFVLNWFEEKATFYGITLTGLFNRANVQVIQRFCMSNEMWYKCTRPYCEAVFSNCRDTKCPECLEEPGDF